METDHVEMLCNIGELNRLFEGSSYDDLLSGVVDMVADHMKAQVCSIYLYNEKSDELILSATHGLKKSSVHNIRMSINEGLCGLALREQRPVCEDVGSSNPNFKFYPGINEELYEAFLAVPIIRGKYRIGVITVQREREKSFSEQDIMAMRATASQLATMMENIRLFMALQDTGQKKDRRGGVIGFMFFKGRAASQGHVLGPAKIVNKKSLSSLFEIVCAQDQTLEDFQEAIRKTEEQLEDLQEKVEQKLSDAASLIFASHLLMLKDPGFTGSIEELILQGSSPRDSLLQVYSRYRDMFSRSDNILIREKVQDLEDLSQRIAANLASHQGGSDDFRDHILVSQEIFPSDLLKYAVMGISGMVLVSGGVTSHVSILSRSLDIPLIFINDPVLLDITDNTPVLVDADTGNLYVNPGEEVLSTFKARHQAGKTLVNERSAGPLKTRDGKPVSVMVNVNLLSDLKDPVPDLVDGIGLYRTEFPFIIRNSFPSEEEQFIIYKKLVDSMKGKTVTFRTLDIGGDKVLSYYDSVHEENPFLGMRSIRFSLTHREIFRQQIRAILRAGEGADLKIMFPMISSLHEFRTAREIAEECMAELASKGVPHCVSPAFGIMVEIPSAVAIIDDLAKESDFLSIGTNDLIQYTLAVDRTNEKVSSLYMPHHPAILRFLKNIAEAGINNNTDVSICGDMGNNPAYIPFLLGTGIDIFSVDGAYISRVRETVKGIDLNEARDLSRQALSLSKCDEIEKLFFSEGG